jgi:hypothetical protein
MPKVHAPVRCNSPSVYRPGGGFEDGRAVFVKQPDVFSLRARLLKASQIVEHRLRHED